MPKTIFRFQKIPYGAGFAEVRFVRDSSPDEEHWNPTSQEILIDVAPELILRKPDDEEIAESATGNPVISELALVLLDTFQPGFIQANGHKIGLTGYAGQSRQPVVAKSVNFSLFSLITAWDVASAIKEKPVTILPPDGIDIELYINGSHKRTATLAFDSTGWNEEFLYAHTEKAEHLEHANQFYVYDAAEKVIDIVGRDKIKYLLEQFDPADVNHWGAYFSEPYGNTGMASIPENLVTRNVYWGSNGTSNFRRVNSWQGFSVSDIFNAVYTKAFGKGGYTVASERTKWKFKPAGIPTTSFISNASGGYRHYFCKRENTLNPVDHYDTEKFNLLKTSSDDDEIFMHYQYLVSLPGADHPYSFTKYKNGWEVITRLAASFGYRVRFTWKNGIPHIIHTPRKRRPPRLKIPPFVKDGSKVTPHELSFDAVRCKPWTEFGEYASHRYIDASPHYDDGVNGNWETYCKLHEPVNDKSKHHIDWEADIDYFSYGHVRNEENVPLYAELYAPKSGQKYKNVFECQTVFGLFGNLMYHGFGQSADAHMSPEFPCYLLGKLTDKTINNQSRGGDWDETPYPGLILLAGGSNDGGKTIDKNIDTETGDPDLEALHPDEPAGWTKYITRFHRGCGTIEVPFGDDGQYITCHTAEEALAVDLSQYKLGVRRKQTLVLPGLSQYENDLGETGWDAAYTGLMAVLYGLDMDILRVKKMMEDDKVEIDVEEIPPMESVPTPEPIVADTYTACGRTVWNMGPDYFWRGRGGDSLEQHRHVSNNDGNCNCGGSGGGGGTDEPKIPPVRTGSYDPENAAQEFYAADGQTSDVLKAFDGTNTVVWGVTPEGGTRTAGLIVPSGADKSFGTVDLVSGTATVTNNRVTANSVIFLQHKTVSGTPGVLTYTVSAGTSFTITSSSGGIAETGDNSRVGWFIVEPS